MTYRSRSGGEHHDSSAIVARELWHETCSGGGAMNASPLASSSLRSSLLVLLSLATSVVVTACASSSGNGSPGTAPVISDFTLTPAALSVGKTTEVNGTMKIDDPDGDLASASGSLRSPDGSEAQIQPVNLSGSAMSVEIQFKIPALPTPTAGDYVVTVEATDHAGNTSNKATFTLTAK